MTKIVKKIIAGLRPTHPPHGAAPLPPTQVGGKCLPAVVLDNQDRALRRFKLDASSSFPTFLCYNFSFPRRFTCFDPISPSFYSDPPPTVTVPWKP